ncbi:MAG: homocysteine S-methyltransferase family protein [Candidatus Latescibacteria bacterium]|nr:homocysteine S-methyltransferase family protein [Candidatus Latescibacterota bacterium]
MHSLFLDHLRQGALLADGAMGSYLFERTGRLSERNHVYEALNLDHPELILQIHNAYLQAGARCLTTNTFAAGRSQLDPLGEGLRCDLVNRAGVRLARRAIELYQATTQDPGPFFVLGSLGPPAEEVTSPAELAAHYQQALAALLAEGVDALLLETFTSLPQLLAVVELIQSQAQAPPLAVEMVGTSLANPAALVAGAAERGVQLVGANCCAPWEVTAFLDAVQDLPAVREGRVLLSAMPNAGGFQRIGHRYMTHVNPEFMGRFARTLAERGVSLVGGCCEVHPLHLAEMRNYLHGRRSGASAPVVAPAAHTAAGPAEKTPNGGFSRKLLAGEFAVSVEILPARGTAPKTLQGKIDFVGELAASGLADALDITDGSRGIPLMPPGDFIGVLRERLGWTPSAGDHLELIPHFTTRDLNLMALQSRLIGYHARRIHNVLFVTGDPPKMSPSYPRSTAVFDCDSAAMIRYAQTCLNAGVDFGGEPLSRHPDPRTHFTVGSGFEPEALDPSREREKLERKLDAGADYIMTQPAFRTEPLATLEPYRRRAAFLVGVMVLSSLDQARRLGQVPGVVVPETVFQRLGAFSRSEDQARAGAELAVEQIRWIRQEGWSGLYLMSPGAHQPVLGVLAAGLG